MNARAPLLASVAKSAPSKGACHSGLLLQRKCACGSPTGSLTGSCPECGNKKLLQTKLTIGASNDPLEQEADRVADQVLAAPAHSAINSAPPGIQRFTGQSSAQTDIAPASVDRVLASPGRPLEPALRRDMEQRFGHDFSSVRVHSGQTAEQSARDVNANAYTVGHDVVFGAGRFAPGSHEGRRLIAHELTHVVQQSGSGRPRTPQSGEISGLAYVAHPTLMKDESAPPANGRPEPVTTRDDSFEPNKQETAPSQKSSNGVQTLCFAISELVSALSPGPRLFGAVAELIINSDYCKLMGCSPFLVPGSHATDYFDNSMGAPFYIAFLGTHNNLSPSQIATIAVASLISLNRPDVLTHKNDRKEYYEIKPNSVSGRAAGRLKLRSLESFYAGLTLPYTKGSAYTPTAEILLSSGHVGPFPLEVFLRLTRLQDGLIVYDICARGELFKIGLATIIAILIALIIVIIGGKVENPIPLPVPELPAPSPVPSPVPRDPSRQPIPVPN